MSITAERVSFDQAMRAAAAISAELDAVCERIAIVGSLRRQKPTVGDIELLVVPLQETADLFGRESKSLLIPRLDALCAAGRIVFDRGGDKHRHYRLEGGLKLDVFISDVDRWGIEHAITTGPERFSKALVTPKSAGGLLPPGLRVGGGWRLLRGDEVIPTPEETDFFRAIGMPWIEPRDRR